MDDRSTPGAITAAACTAGLRAKLFGPGAPPWPDAIAKAFVKAKAERRQHCRVTNQMSQAARRHRSAAQGASRSQYQYRPIPTNTEHIGKRCHAAMRFDGQRRPTDDR